MTHWSEKFVGIPQLDGGRDLSGVDNCWVLGCVIFAEELHISLPDYLGQVSPDEQDEVAALIEGERHSPLWLPVEGQAIAFDVALFRMGRYTSHVGIVVRHGLMVHLHGDGQSNLERYDGGRWSHRFEGHFRHRERAIKYPVQQGLHRPVQLIGKAAP